MSEFTASNGVGIHRTTAGLLALSDYMYLSGTEEMAWREFFQHERDEELGRWRDTGVLSKYVVYRHGATLLIVHESDGTKDVIDVSWAQNTQPAPHHANPHLVAIHWAEAHPERRPWEEARTGDVWVLNVPAGQVIAVRRFDGEFYDYEGNRLVMGRATDARRIWPEDAS